MTIKGARRCHPERYSAKDLAETAMPDASRSTAQYDSHMRLPCDTSRTLTISVVSTNPNHQVTNKFKWSELKCPLRSQKRRAPVLNVPRFVRLVGCAHLTIMWIVKP